MTKPQEDVTAIAVTIGGGRLWVELEDGRVIGTPLEWYMPLANATSEELKNYELLGDIIHWPDLDEDLSVPAMLAGVRPRYPWSVEEWRARLDSIRTLDERYGSEATILLPIHMTDPLDARVTVREIAEDYGLSTDAVYQAIRRERLPARRSGGTWLIRRRDAEALWGSAPQAAAPSEEHDVTHNRPIANDIHDSVEIESWLFEFLSGFFIANALAISNPEIQQDEEFHITAQKKAGITLSVGNTLRVIDVADLRPLGLFSIRTVVPHGYDAVAIQDIDPLWEGVVREKRHISTPSNIMAFAIPQGA